MKEIRIGGDQFQSIAEQLEGETVDELVIREHEDGSVSFSAFAGGHAGKDGTADV